MSGRTNIGWSLLQTTTLLSPLTKEAGNHNTQASPNPPHSPKIRALTSPTLSFPPLTSHKTRKLKNNKKQQKNKTELDIHEQAPIPFLIPFKQVKKKNKREIPKTPSDQIQNSFSNQNKPRPATSPLNRLFSPPSTHHPSPLSLATTSLAVTIVFEDEDELQSVLLSAKVKATKGTHSRRSPDVDCGKHGAVE